MKFSDIGAKLQGLAKFIPWNPGNWKTQALVGVFLLALAIAFATTLHAAEPYVQLGGGSSIIRGHATAMDLSVIYPEAGPEDSDYGFGVTFIGQSVFARHQQPNQFILHGDVIDGFGPLDLGLGVAYLQNTDSFNGSHVNFSISAAWRFRFLPLSLIYRHFSNAGTAMPNVGRDSVFLAWRFGGSR